MEKKRISPENGPFVPFIYYTISTLFVKDNISSVVSMRWRKGGAAALKSVRNPGSRTVQRLHFLRILWRGRWLGGIRILLDFVSLERFLRILRVLVLELLECCHGLLRFLHVMEPPVDDS